MQMILSYVKVPFCSRILVMEAGEVPQRHLAACKSKQYRILVCECVRYVKLLNMYSTLV
jgi:hypothetical protein